MARILRGEQEMDELLIEGQKLKKEVTFLLFWNAGMAVIAGVRWV